MFDQLHLCLASAPATFVFSISMHDRVTPAWTYTDGTAPNSLTSDVNPMRFGFFQYHMVQSYCAREKGCHVCSHMKALLAN